MDRVSQLLIEIDEYINTMGIASLYPHNPDYVTERQSELLDLLRAQTQQKRIIEKNRYNVVLALSKMLANGILADFFEKYNNSMVLLETQQDPEEVKQIREKAKEEIKTLEAKIEAEEKERERQQTAETVEITPEKPSPKKISKSEPIAIYAQPSETVHKFTQKKASERVTRKPRLLNYNPERVHAMKRLAAKPGLNRYKDPIYFNPLIERQRKQFTVTDETANEDIKPILPPRSVQDAYFAYQIAHLVSEGVKTQQWSGFASECRDVKMELKEAIKNGYEPLQLKRHFGPEMVVLGIIERDELPKELSKLVDKLLPDHS